MEKVTKNARIAELESKLMVMQTQINSLIECGHSHTKRLIALEPDNPFHGKFYEPSEPKPKQLDQSIFDGLDAKWRFAAVVADDRALYFDKRPYDSDDTTGHFVFTGDYEASFCGTGYDTSNWQNSLIEREKVELTGSDLARIVLSKQFMQACLVSDTSDELALSGDDLQLIRMYNESEGKFISMRDPWHGCHHKYAVAVDNNRKPLTAADLGL